MKFKTAVQGTLEIATHFRVGLRSLSKAHRSSINARDPRRIAGSVNIDAALRATYPNANRWDYAIGYRISNKNDKAFFVEFHRAKVSEIQLVLRKKGWLESWMTGQPLNEVQRGRFVWVSAGGINILPNSPQRRVLDKNGIQLVRRLKLR